MNFHPNPSATPPQQLLASLCIMGAELSRMEQWPGRTLSDAVETVRLHQRNLLSILESLQ